MAMIDYNEVRERKYIVLDGQPYEVLASHVFRKQQRKPVNDTKLRNLITGKVTEYTFHVSDRVAEAEIEESEVLYLYTRRLPDGRQEYWFCEAKDKAKRFQLPAAVLGEQIRFVRQNSPITLQSFGGKIIGVRLPIKIELKVKEAAPAVKGNTIQGGTKRVILETGVEIDAPMFVNEGDTIIVNSQTGEYVERK